MACPAGAFLAVALRAVAFMAGAFLAVVSVGMNPSITVTRDGRYHGNVRHDECERNGQLSSMANAPPLATSSGAPPLQE